jgi:GAF domain-containing protein
LACLLGARWDLGERWGEAAVAAAGAGVVTAAGLSGRVAEEQAALRRVATLVAGVVRPEEVFAAVAAEVGWLLKADFAVLVQYDPHDAITIVGTWTRTGAAAPTPVGSRLPLGGRNVTTLVCQTGRPARIDYADVSGVIGDVATYDWGLHSSVGVPISVEGHLWGVMVVALTRQELLPEDAEVRLAGFTELVATALANAQARMELRSFAEEQAALRRVATLVARVAWPEEVFAAVTAEVGQLLDREVCLMSRYDPENSETVVATWTRSGTAALPVPVGMRVPLGGRNVSTLVLQTGRAARIDDYADTTGPIGDVIREVGIRASVGVPISVDGRLWGLVLVATRCEPLPADTEMRLAGFTELVATAIANAQARRELRGFADEQAALRRVATLVARAARPEEVFAAVTEEVGRVLEADFSVLSRYDPDGAATVLGVWTRIDPGRRSAIGLRLELYGQNVHTLVSQTRRTARIDYTDACGPGAEVAREWGFRSSVGTPISVEDRLWGVISVGSTREEPLPADTEARLVGFTELVATALANAEAQAALAASRARIVAAADATRRRIERNLHDGAQQRLVSLALHMRSSMQAAVPPGAGELHAQLDRFAAELTGVQDELREIARGLHPSMLAERGLRPALRTLARRSTVPVCLNVRVDGRLPEPIEIAAYYVVAEALTNAAKHAHATLVEIDVKAGEAVLHVRVRDDGRGGANLTGGSGLIGLTDRAEALGGRLSLHSPPGAGTTMHAELPLDPAGVESV